MRKKLLLMITAIITAMLLSSCAGGGQQLPELVLPDEGAESSGSLAEPELDDIKDSDYADDIEGLKTYMKDIHAVTGDPVEMSWEVIGADGGYKYSFTYRTSNVQTELYSFDLDNLTDEAEASLKSIREDGKFTVLETEVNAYISDSGKYVMIYTDASNDAENTEQKDRVVESFQAFHA